MHVRSRPRAFLEAKAFCARIFYFSPSHRQIEREYSHNAAFGYNVYQPVSVAGWSSNDLDNGTPGQRYRYAIAINDVKRKSRALELESSAS